jgi:aldehyde dehydrogenase (NAD+)
VRVADAEEGVPRARRQVANIVLDDADLAAVLPMGAMTCVHGGQGCAITTRLLLPRSRYDEGLAILKSAFEKWNYGDPTNPANLQGPQVSKRQQERVLGYLEKGKKDGARVLVGGGMPKHLAKGFYVEPTLFVDVDPDSTIAQEEIFGPVLCVIPVQRRRRRGAHREQLGVRTLGARQQQERGARARSGAADPHRHDLGQRRMWFNVDTPFGGYKQSGLGRENGEAGFEEYLETKVIGCSPQGS